MVDQYIKGTELGPKRQTMLMNTWFNFYGTVVSILDLILMVMGFELIILAIVNDFNSDIHSDISYHYHYGLVFAAVVLFVASFAGLLGFLRESLPKLCLSWALMIFVVLSLLQSSIISLLYREDLSLLINSDAENVFQLYIYNKSDQKYKRKTEAVMKTFDCCGWNRVEEMLINETLPCHCCTSKEKDPQNKQCNQKVVEKEFNNKFVCRIKSDSLKNKSCQPEVQKSFEEDLANIMNFCILTTFFCVITIILTFVISNDLLKVHHD